MTRLFVAGYPRDATKEDMLALFERFGATGEDIVFPRDRRTRRKKGYAYVTLRDPQSAQRAVAMLHDLRIGENTLNVTLAEERARRGAQRPQ